MSRDPTTRDPVLDAPRVIPLTGKDVWRRLAGVLGLLFDVEWHTTSDQKRFFFNNEYMGPYVRHDPVANEATMLAINSTSSRGCWPGDTVRRTDRGNKFTCVSNNGTDISDWEEDLPPEGSTGANLEPVCEDEDVLFDSDDANPDGDILMEEAEPES